MWVLSLDTISILDVNKAAVKLYGYTYIEFIGKDMIDLVAEEERERFIECCKNRSIIGDNAGLWKHITKDGKEIQVEILTFDTKYTEKPSLLIISNDITEKVRS